MQRIELFLKRRQHSSIFIAYISCGVLLGVGVSILPKSSMLLGMGWVVFALLLCIICFYKRNTWMLGLAIVAGLLLGIARATPVLRQLEAYDHLHDKGVQMKGVVIDDTATGRHGDKQIKLTDLETNNTRYYGTLWVSTATELNIKRGHEVVVRGVIQEGFGSFAASMYRARVVEVRDTHADKAREIRDGFNSAVNRFVNEPQASLGIGFLTGQKTNLSDNLEEQLRVVGLTHIVVASGYNLTILVRFTRRIFARVSKYLAAMTGGLMIAGFMLVTGLSPSMSRAGLVAGLSLAAWYYGRRVHPLVLLPFAAAITVLINPSFMWGDMGWYLSFAAFAGVMLVAPLLQHYFFGAKKPATIRQIVGETISAQLATLPIIAMSFGVVALFALPANLLVLPFVPLAMLLVFVTGIFALILPIVAPVFGFLAYMILNYMTSVVSLFSQIPNATTEIKLGSIGVIIFYTVLILIGLYLWKVTKHDFKNDNLIE